MPKEKDNEQGGLAWRESHLMLAYMQMYRATSDRKYLRKLTNRFDEILLVRDDRLGRIDDYTSRPLAGWGSARYDKKAKWHVFIVHTGMITMGPAEFVSAVKADDALQKEFATSATAYHKAIEECLDDTSQYWRETTGTQEGWYVDPQLGLLPLNQSNALGCVLLEMYGITGKRQYLERATKLAYFFKNRLRENNGRYDWAYWPKEQGTGTGYEDISHAGLNIRFAVKCARKDIVFTPQDIDKFTQTWLHNVRRSDGNWAGDVGGQRESKTYMPGSAGWWLVLCELLTAETANQLHADVARAYATYPVQMPSHAVGLANLMKYQAVAKLPH